MKNAPKEFNEFSKSRSADRISDIAIVKTLSYRAFFNYPMSYYQLSTFLITNKKIDIHRHYQAVKRLAKNKKIFTLDDGSFVISGINPLSWKERYLNSKRIIEDNSRALNLLSKIPWIKLISITGAVAAFNADTKDDLDIFIITAKKRVWITRLFVFLILKTIGKYPKDKDIENKVCPNLYIDETALRWSEPKRNVYIAHEIYMMHPILNKEDTYFKFIKENMWIKDFFANFTADYNLPTQKLKSGSLSLDKIEQLLMKTQVMYMKKKQTKEQVTEAFIHFNKNDWSDKILSSYKKLSSKNS
jgi:hypothetical protein